MLDRKDNIVVKLTAILSSAVKSVLEKFSSDCPSERMYAFALIAPPEGTDICCAIATEEALEHVAKSYKSMGYIAESGDTLTLLRQELRWANPDDGWHYYSFQEDSQILLELQKAFDSNRIEMFDGTTESICIEALRQLDQEHIFGSGKERENIVISFTYGEDPEDFVRFSEQVNSPSIFQRIRKELTESYTVQSKMKTPYD